MRWRAVLVGVTRQASSSQKDATELCLLISILSMCRRSIAGAAVPSASGSGWRARSLHNLPQVHHAISAPAACLGLAPRSAHAVQRAAPQSCTQLSFHGHCLCRLLQRSDWFTQEKACRLLAAILAARPDKSGSSAPASKAGPSSGSAVSAAAEGVHATQVCRAFCMLSATYCPGCAVA
jgi:hypothetical protein